MKRFYGPLALLLLIGGEILLFSGHPWVGKWFYILAWWPYIFFVDWLVKRRTGNSLILDRTKEFLLLIPWSTFIWLIFEWFNLYLHNWHYINIISSLPWRWLGYFIAYGTVLPGLFETYELLLAYNVLKEIRIKPLKDARKAYPWFILLGIISLTLPIAYPLYFFPLVWGSFFFILEPINHALKAPSLLKDWETGSLNKFVLLLMSGLICGFLWEFWNFWAISKWVYTVPFVGKIKLFEMPILGFLGFPPFTVECYTMIAFISIFQGGLFWERETYRPIISYRLPGWLLVIIHILFDIFMFHQIDIHTVVNYIS